MKKAKIIIPALLLTLGVLGGCRPGNGNSSSVSSDKPSSVVTSEATSEATSNKTSEPTSEVTSETPSTSETTSEVTTIPSVEEPSSESPTSETPVTSSSLVTPSTSETPTTSEEVSSEEISSEEESSESIIESISSMISSIFSSDISSSEYSSISQETTSSEEISSEEISSNTPTSEESSSSNVNVNLNTIYGGYYASISSWTNGEDLKNQLQELISSNITPVKYNSNWEVNASADQSQTNFDMVEQVYSTDEIFKTSTYSSSNTKGWQKEHAFCQSLMNHYVSGAQKICEIQEGFEVSSIEVVGDEFILTHSDGKQIIVRRLANAYKNEENKTAMTVYYVENGKIIKDYMLSNQYVADGDEVEICQVSDIKKFVSDSANSINFVNLKVELNDGTFKNLETINRLYIYKEGEGSHGGVASDYHNLFASNSSGNSARSNKQLGVVEDGTASYDYKATDTLFEPNDSDKGKLARAILYMDTCYDDVSLLDGLFTEDQTLFYNQGMHGNRDIIVSWAQEYLVDYHEYQHNVVVQDYQGNRNPYIDFPGLIDYVYGDKQNQSGTLLDVYNTSSYVELSLGEHNYKNLALANVKYTYEVGEKFTKSDVGNAYIVYTDLSTSAVDVNALDFTISDYTFKDSDIGTKVITVSDGQTQVQYQIEVTSKNPLANCEYIHSFLKSDGSADSTTYKDVDSSKGPLTVSCSGIDFVYTVANGKRGTGSQTKGVGFGSGTTPVGTLTIESSTNVNYNSSTYMNAVYVNACNANAGSFTVSLYVGDTLIGSEYCDATSSTLLAFAIDPSLEGKLKIEFTNVNKTLYIKEIAINFD
ncbi:MAG: hypothetical protein E7180_01190 [Erysipelotrichaceae bacterium]|nr:hypothetical protein [Erysipelotrichaceae bacterium]